MKILALILSATACLVSGPVAWAQPAPAVPADFVPARIVDGVKPRYPVRMLNDGVTGGSVHVMLYVDASGARGDTLVTAYSRKAFADEVMTAIKRWKFTPGMEKGKPVDTIIDLTFNFEVNGVVVVQNREADRAFGKDRYADFEYQPAAMQDLDRVPTPLNIVEPTYPREWIKQGIVGNVTVDFYIDETGQTRFPTAAPGANDQLAGIVIAAVQQWRFIPPKAKDRPVLVHAQQVFQFGADEKP